MQVMPDQKAQWAHNQQRLAAGLEHYGISELCHIARAHDLPEIVHEGALLSVFEQGFRHGFSIGRGHGDKDGFTRGYVSLSYRPAWFLCRKPRPPELAILVIDALAAVLRPGTVFSPGNSASSLLSERNLRASHNLAVDADQRFAACFTAGVPKDQAEVLVEDELPWGAVTRVVFCDQEAREYWWPKVTTQGVAPLPTPSITEPSEPWSFPADFVPATRRRG
jgi:ssDNA thymidine ADP-ribosyltransferase, DarT